MARIRTFKPEFFRSPDTAKASPRARILFLAMWSWADDQGVGETNLYGLLGFAFPDSDAVSVEEIQSLLKEVRGSFEVEFYENRGRYFYSIPTFGKHQKTERKAEGRYPGPEDPESRPDLRFENTSGDGGNSSPPEGSSGTGTGEQGNIGTGEPGTESVGTTEVCHQSADDVAPSKKCDRHRNIVNPPDCGGCAAANRAFREWNSRRERRERDELAEQRRLKDERALRQRNCPRCHGTNSYEDEHGGVHPCGTHLEAM